jgi:stage II sporulation protein D
LFHADCGGHTAAAEIVWGGDRVPYLVGTPDEVPAKTHREWRFDVTATNLRNALAGDTRSDVGRRLASVAIGRRDASGRAVQVTLRGDRVVTLRGEQLRAIMNRAFGATAMQSTKFTVTRTAEGYRFDGAGYGHGVGLCQVGATARARRGESIEGILTTYYPGAKAVRVRQPSGRAALPEPAGLLASLLESP